MSGNEDRTRLTRTGARRIATISIDAEVTETIRTIGTRGTEFRFTRAHAIARLGRSGTSTHIVLAIGNVRAGADATRKIASLAGRGTPTIATNAIHAKTTETFRAGRTRLSVFFFAYAHAVTRLVCPRASGYAIGVVLSGREIRTNPDCTGDVARLAGAAT